MVRLTKVFAVFAFLLAVPAFSAISIVGANNITVTVDVSGTYSVTVPDLSWSFSGSVGAPLTNLQTGSGADALGGYSEVSFNFHTDAARHASIRSYHDRPQVMFAMSNPASAAARLPAPAAK